MGPGVRDPTVIPTNVSSPSFLSLHIAVSWSFSASEGALSNDFTGSYVDGHGANTIWPSRRIDVKGFKRMSSARFKRGILCNPILKPSYVMSRLRKADKRDTSG